MTNIPLFVRVVCLYIVAGLIIWGGAQLSSRQSNAATFQVVQTASTPQPAVDSVAIESGQPSRLVIERLGIDLSVRDGIYDSTTDEWTLSDDAAFFARMTTLPNDTRGNTFIYGHNTDQVLASVKDLIVGDIVKLVATNGLTFTYSYRDDDIVAPNATAVLEANFSTPQLTLMTCEGIWSNERRLMYFEFKEVQ